MTLVDLLLLLAILVIVPLALNLVPFAFDPPWRQVVVTAAGVAAAGSYLVAQGTVAAVLALPWLLFAITLGIAQLAAWLGPRSWSVDRLAPLVASGFLVFAAVWLVLDRAGAEVLGVGPPLVQLTSVHYHYAAFTATVLTARVAQASAATAPRLALLAFAAVALSSPVIAIGFGLIDVLQPIGAVILTAGLWLASWLTWRHVAAQVGHRGARVLLIISAVAVLAPMVLAVQWATGSVFGTPALSIPAMARTHGMANAFGYSLCGVVAWRAAGVRPG